MHPTKSFIIWFTPRTGSTLLCKALEQTGCEGKADEFLNIPEEKTLRAHYGVDDFIAFRNLLWTSGSSDNGVMGIKFSLYKFIFDKINSELKDWQGMEDVDAIDWRIWKSLFPNCNHIYLTRRNKIRLAVSWWKAIQDQQWHREKNEPHTQVDSFYASKYDYNALKHLLKENNLREAAIQSYFDFNQITPLTIVYEDFIRDYSETVYRILDYLDIPGQSLTIEAPYYAKTANHNSEKWVQQFRKDLQKKLGSTHVVKQTRINNEK